jgi:RND family efflux transporter MFP subunit
MLLLVVVYLKVKANNESTPKQNFMIPVVQLSNPSRGNLINKLTFSGDIAAIEQINVYSRVNGNISRIYVNIGDYVSQGKLLAIIDPSIYQQNVKQTEALYKQAQATFENNQLNYERNKDLYQKGLISQTDLDNSRTAVDVSRAQMESANANYQNAITQLSYCNIRAPFSGYITKRLLDPGSYISTGGTSQNTIFTLSKIDGLKVMVNVLEKDIPLLDKVKEARITVDTYPGEVFIGNLKAISQSIDLTTRTMQTEVDIDNKNQMLKPGMFATIDLILDKAENAMILPVQTILKDEKGNFVYTITPDSIANKKYVQTGIHENNNYEIKSGLDDNDKVVFLGQDQVKDGRKVKIAK